jgi:hypothetical protein
VTLKATPKAGFRIPKLKNNEEIVAFRPSGHTALTGKQQNFNFNMQLEKNDKNKNRFVIACVLLSFVPFVFFIKNAEENFRKSEIKKIAEKRRRAMDEAHGVNREELNAQYEELDRIYRVSEKEEIKKYHEIGKTAGQYYADQEARSMAAKEKEL